MADGGALTAVEVVLGGVHLAGKVRPHPGETESGDGWGVWPREDGCRVAVVDGLGHGPAAAEATRTALASLASSVHVSVEEALLRCDTALRGTRGAAISVADVEPLKARLTYAGVGNVEAQLWRVGMPSQSERPIVYRGVVGGTMRRVRSCELALAGEWRLLVYTDGVSGRLILDDLDMSAPPEAVVSDIVARWGRMTDDATAVLVAPAAPQTLSSGAPLTDGVNAGPAG